MPTSTPLQLSLFPNHIRLTHSVPDANQHRFYVLRTLPTSFGEWDFFREWGRLGSPESDAISALAKLAQQKHRRGYALQEML